MLIINALIDDRVCDVRFGRTIEAVGSLKAVQGESSVDAAGARLLPGLHDHHVHLRASAARRQSIDISGVTSLEELAVEVQQVPGAGWIRCVGYRADRLGELDRLRLDDVCLERPIRVQHNSGKMWVVNSCAIERLNIEPESHDGVEVIGGQMTGRFFRMDDWLDDHLPRAELDLDAVIDELVSYGITSVTDTSYTNDGQGEKALNNLRHASGERFSVRVMGDESLVQGGQLKIVLDEDALPDPDVLRERVRRAHEADRGVAFHCVSRVELLIAMEAFKSTAHHPHDRLEHGALIGADLVKPLRDLGIPVVTQPGFIRDRGEQFRSTVRPDEIVDLYRYKSLLDAGIVVIASSDAPYGPTNPWICQATAQDRQTEIGKSLNIAECVTAEEALSGYLLTDDLHRERTIDIGEKANLCLMAKGARLDNEYHMPSNVWLNGRRVVVGANSGAT